MVFPHSTVRVWVRPQNLCKEESIELIVNWWSLLVFDDLLYERQRLRERVYRCSPYEEFWIEVHTIVYLAKLTVTIGIPVPVEVRVVEVCPQIIFAWGTGI